MNCKCDLYRNCLYVRKKKKKGKKRKEKKRKENIPQITFFLFRNENSAHIISD